MSISQQQPQQPATRREINWGGVIKGVAIVTAAVVVVAVAGLAFNALATTALGSSAVSTITAAAIQVGTPIIEGLKTGFAFLSQLHPLSWIAEGASKFSSTVGFTAAKLSAENITTVSKTVAALGAGTAAALAAPTVARHLGDLQLTREVPQPPMMPPAPPPGPAMTLRPKAANWQEYVGKPQAAASPAKSERSTPTPQADFASQVNADRQALEASLGSKIL